jgi:aminopeptidase N
LCSIKPSNYNLSLFDLELGGSWTYQGKVDIDVEVKRETKEIVLNTHHLKVHSAEISTNQGKTEGSLKASNISFDEKNQRATFHFDQSIPQSHKALLSISFSGIMNNDVRHVFSLHPSYKYCADQSPPDGWLLPLQVQAYSSCRCFCAQG